MANKHQRSCDTCMFGVERSGVLRTKTVCMSKDPKVDPKHNGAACSVYLSKLQEQNAERVVTAVTSWAKGEAPSPRAVLRGTPQKQRAAEHPDYSKLSPDELAVKAAEAKLEAAEAKAAVADAKAKLLEEQLKAARDSENDTKQ